MWPWYLKMRSCNDRGHCLEQDFLFELGLQLGPGVLDDLLHEKLAGEKGESTRSKPEIMSDIVA